EAGAHEDEIRLEGPSLRNKLRLERLQKLRVSCPDRHGHIELRADGAPLAALRFSARARIGAVMMRAEVENRRILVEDVLRAVAVVIVPIDDQRAADAVDLLQIARRDGDVVEYAET